MLCSAHTIPSRIIFSTFATRWGNQYYTNISTPFDSYPCENSPLFRHFECIFYWRFFSSLYLLHVLCLLLFWCTNSTFRIAPLRNRHWAQLLNISEMYNEEIFLDKITFSEKTNLEFTKEWIFFEEFHLIQLTKFNINQKYSGNYAIISEFSICTNDAVILRRLVVNYFKCIVFVHNLPTQFCACISFTIVKLLVHYEWWCKSFVCLWMSLYVEADENCRVLSTKKQHEVCENACCFSILQLTFAFGTRLNS